MMIAKYVDEKFAPGSKPLADSMQQYHVIAHVLKHLHRHDTIETLVRAEIIDVGGLHGHIFQAPCNSKGFNRLPLAPGIRNRGNGAVGILFCHPKG